MSDKVKPTIMDIVDYQIRRIKELESRNEYLQGQIAIYDKTLKNINELNKIMEELNEYKIG